MYYIKDLKQLVAKDAGALTSTIGRKVGTAFRLRDKAANTEDGAILETFRVTDSGIDREGDIILSSGMDVGTYQAHGSLLWGHRADLPELVLGAPVEIMKGETSIDVTFRFASEDVNPTGAMVGRQVRDGLVSGTSVGIIIKEYTVAEDRAGFMPLNILASELVEISVTPIMANPRAVRREDQKHLIQTCEIVLDNSAPEERDPATEALWKALRDEKTMSDVVATDPVVATFVKASRQ